MTFANKATVNFAGGEVAPGVLARTDLPIFAKVLQRMENFIALPQGPARYRAGSKFVHHTRNHNKGIFIDFQFSDIQAYEIEATKGYFRFYKDGAVILDSNNILTITGISKANPGVVTYTGTDPINGQEVFVDGVAGMTEVNSRFFTVASVNTGANTFQLTDEFGNNIDTSAYTAWASGGEATPIYEIKTPYLEEDLETIKYDQNADTMYLTNNKYEPRKLVRSAHDSWTLSRYARTNDPFAAENVTFGTITAVTVANPGVVSDAGHTFVTGDHVYISGIVGMVELNDRHFTIGTTAAGTYQLKDYDTGVVVDTSGYTAWSSGGVVELVNPTRATSQKYPAAVGFTDDARLGMAGSIANPETQWYSRGPSAAGAVRFDDYTTGSLATDALTFTLAPLQGRVDSVRWMTNTDKYIALGTFGSIRRVFGETESAPISADAVTAKGANSDGVHPTSPVTDGSVLFYVGRSGLSLEALEYDYQIDGYQPDDKNLVSDHLTVGGIKQLARQVGRPTLIWAVRNDGRLLALTYKGKENIAGWHRHRIGGDGIVEWVGIMPRENNQDQLWMIVRRSVNGNTVRYIEYLTDWPTYPNIVDFYTGPGNQENDRERWLNYQNEVMKNAIHVDASATYNGNIYGLDAGASITMGEDADTRESVNIPVTASAAVFTSSMVGRQIWGAYTSEGIGGGRIEITEFVSSTVVKGTIIDEFPATATYEAGDWFITATTMGGLYHLEGATVGVITDGAVPDDVTVENATITITQPASVIHVGLRYRGVMITLPMEQGGVSGPAQNKPKNVAEVAIRFIDSAGCQFGTSLYRLKDIEFRRGDDFTDRAVPLFTGMDKAHYEDSWEGDKILIIMQELPLPCTIASIDIFMDTTDE